MVDASAPSGSCRMRRCDQVALLDMGFAIQFSGNPHSDFANAVSHGLCAVGKGAHNSDASQRRGYIVYLAWFYLNRCIK
ncbi:MAG: hypothetical protein DME93_02105 [Verrucomicrobia bacterium]|nr:MAG: hypothetical protein DME93_02105 [Verrucomicrobiota bacterium]